MFVICYLIVTFLIMASLIIICWRNRIWPQILDAGCSDYDDLDVIFSHEEDFIPECEEIDLERIENGF